MDGARIRGDFADRGVAPALAAGRAHHDPSASRAPRRSLRSWLPAPRRPPRKHAMPHPPHAAAPGSPDHRHLRRVARVSTQGPTAAEPAPWDYRKAMKAFAPVIGVKPSSGALFGVAGNIAFYRGDPATTRISSVVTSLTFSTKGQIALTDRFTMFGRRDRWRARSRSSLSVDLARDAAARHERRHRRQRAHRLRFLPAASHRVLPAAPRASLPARGIYFDNHINIGPREETMTTASDASGRTSPFVQYSEATDLPLDSQASVGPSVDLHAGTPATASSTPRTAGSRRPATACRLTASSARTRAGRRWMLDVRTYRPLVGQRPSHARRVDVRRCDRRRRGAVSRSAGDRPRYLWAIGPRLWRRAVPRRAAGLRRDRVSRHADEERPAGDGRVRERHHDQQPGAGGAAVRQRRDRRRRRASPVDQQAIENQSVF